MSGPFGSSQWMYNASSGFYDFEISNSLRFNDGDSAYLTKTPSSASNRKTWTWSGWVKRGIITTDQVFFGARALSTSTPYFYFGFNTSTDILAQNSNNAGALYTTQKFRDTSAWYHIVYAVDTTQGTASNRVKVYVNGSQITDFGTENNPSQNVDTAINSTIAHWTGIITNGAGSRTDPIDGYMADVNFIDGTALTPSSFGELKNDIWIPKDTSGLTFGTNGYRLEFKQTGTGTASSSTIGADTSGNDNHWTSTNLVASDVVPDSPTNNFATMNPLDATDANVTYSEGNLHTTTTSGGNAADVSSTMTAHGKVYAEFLIASSVSSAVGPFVQNANKHDNLERILYQTQGIVYNPDAITGHATFTNGDLLSIAYDAVNKRVWFGKNNTYIYGNPANGTDGVTNANLLGDGNVVLGISDGSGGSIITVHHNFGQNGTFNGTKTAQGNADENGIGDFYYAPPSGFLAMCTSNLPDPVETVDPAQGGSPQDYFNTVLYTGAGSGADANTVNTVGFQPDFTWIRNRGDAEAHVLQDSVRGVAKFLQSDTTNQDQNTGGGDIKAFNSSGFILGYTNNRSNATNDTYVAWNWKAGTAFSNDASATGVGSIDSSGSVSADTGFSIISYTGTGSAGTVAHGLSSAPDMILIKDRDNATYNWVVYHSANTSAPETDYLRLNLANATADYDHWNDTAPTSSVFSLSSYDWANKNSDAMIAYCFAGVDGFSKFGKYTGNGNTDGPFVYTGFRPAWVMVKRTDASGHWAIGDTKRLGYNVDNNPVYANLTNVEGTDDWIDFVSNGFKIRASTGDFNTNNGTYIYMAFAEQPFKYANGR